MPGRSLGLALLATLLLLPACGRDDGVVETRIAGDSLTVFSSLPLQGPLATVARDMVRAEKLALREARGRAGVFNVNYVSLDSADPETGAWDPGRVAANARRAVQTPNAIAYLGELEPGASSISLPLLNAGGLLQVSPRDTFAGLTEPGGRGEPERYYPSGVLTFARAVPASDTEAQLVVAAMAGDDVRRLVLADDRRPAGSDLGDRVARLAARAGIEVVARKRLDGGGDVPQRLGADVRGERPDAFFYAGASSDFAAGVLRGVHAVDPGVKLYGGDELTLAPTFGRRAGAAASRLRLVGIDPRESAAFARRFEAAYGTRPDRHAVLGYRAMRLVLAAVRASGKDADSRRAVVGRAIEMAGGTRARFARYRIARDRVARVRSPM